MEPSSKEILLRFGENLGKIKKAKNLTYRQIATRCNLDHSDIKKYVDGKINPSLLTLIELSKGFEVDPTEFFHFNFRREEF